MFGGDKSNNTEDEPIEEEGANIVDPIYDEDYADRNRIDSWDDQDTGNLTSWEDNYLEQI